MGIKISATSIYLPSNHCSNEYYEKKFSLEKGGIKQRTGIESRYFSDPDMLTSDLGCKVVKQIEARNEAQFLINISSGPDSLVPSNANRIANKLSLHNIIAFDLMAGGCASFLYAFTIAYSMLQSGLFKSGILVAAEKSSLIIDEENSDTAPLFGDASAAWLVEYSPKENVFGYFLGCDSSGVQDLYIPAKGEKQIEGLQPGKVYMDGRKVFKCAVERLSESIIAAISAAKFSISDIDYFIIHQANERIITQVAGKLGVEMERVLLSIHSIGNVMNASIPVTYHLNQDKLRGKIILLAAFGAGYNYGAIVLKV